MEINFHNVDAAVKFLSKQGDEVSLFLMGVLGQHAAQEQEVVITTSAEEVINMKFTSTHEVPEATMEISDSIVVIHSVDSAVHATVKQKPTTGASAPEQKTSDTKKVSEEPKRSAPSFDGADDDLATKVGKVVLTVGAIGAAAAAGVWAWKKWGKSST